MAEVKSEETSALDDREKNAARTIQVRGERMGGLSQSY